MGTTVNPFEAIQDGVEMTAHQVQDPTTEHRHTEHRTTVNPFEAIQDAVEMTAHQVQDPTTEHRNTEHRRRTTVNPFETIQTGIEMAAHQVRETFSAKTERVLAEVDLILGMRLDDICSYLAS